MCQHYDVVVFILVASLKRRWSCWLLCKRYFSLSNERIMKIIVYCILRWLPMSVVVNDKIVRKKVDMIGFLGLCGELDGGQLLVNLNWFLLMKHEFGGKCYNLVYQVGN